MTFDCATFNGEYDMLEIRFELLNEFVDTFILVESTVTFSGNSKPLYWKTRDNRFKNWESKVVYRVVSEFVDEEIIGQSRSRDYINTNGFKRAFYQKESIRKVLETLNPNDEDVIYYGDIDEVWIPQVADDKPHKLRQLAYSYYLNNRSPEDWRGTVVVKWKDLKGKCLNDLRANPVEVDILENGGYHWTNLGGYEAVKHKIESYDHTEVNIPFVKDGLAERIEKNVDFLGRGFEFWLDESQLPKYLLENKEKWKHLFR